MECLGPDRAIFWRGIRNTFFGDNSRYSRAIELKLSAFVSLGYHKSDAVKNFEIEKLNKILFKKFTFSCHGRMCGQK
jgi:hypothetical protein